MTRALYNIKLTVTLQAPYLVHGNDPGRHGLDATLLLNHRKIPILPGTLLQGRIAECWTALSAELGGADAKKWFGQPGNDPERARLLVQDLVLTKVDDKVYTPESAPPEHDTVRIALDDERGAVKSNALLIIEQLCPVGAMLEFSGDWQVWAVASEITLLKQQIHAALLLQTQLGAYRGVGFGRLKSVMVKKPEPVLAPVPAQNKSLAISLASRQRLALSFAEPICVNAKSRRGNVFESGNVIPGGAILGALADMLKFKYGKTTLADIAGGVIPNGPDKAEAEADAMLIKHFDKLRCTHALPSFGNGKRPLPLPKSLVLYKKQGAPKAAFLDAFRCNEPPPSLDEAPKFQTDWKDPDFTEAGKRQCWPPLPRHLRLRTAIEAGQAKKAPKPKPGDVPIARNGERPDSTLYTPEGEPWDKGSLFAYDCVYAATDEHSKLESNWQFDLYLPESALGEADKNDRQAINASLASLLAQGLAPIGKTGACAVVHQVEGDAAQDQWPSHTAGWKKDHPWLVPVLLVTDTLLFTTNALLPDEQGKKDKQGKPQFSLDGTPLKTLKEIYADCFNQLALGVLNVPLDTLAENNPAIHLSHIFATQKLQGGDYLNKRFGKNEPYQPKVLTEAGSVFVFKIIDAAKAQTVFEHWRENGLALPEAVKDAYGYAWKSHPYLPQNGYGEVAIAPDHGFDPLITD